MAEYAPTSPQGRLLAAYAAGLATWDETMEALRGFTQKQWGIAEVDPPDRLTFGDPDWWQSVEDRAFSDADRPQPPQGSPLTDLKYAHLDGLITTEQWEQVYDLVDVDL